MSFWLSTDDMFMHAKQRVKFGKDLFKNQIEAQFININHKTWSYFHSIVDYQQLT